VSDLFFILFFLKPALEKGIENAVSWKSDVYLEEENMIGP
jgi:hypothetical protein